jgi:hypothetical protein
MRLGPVTPSHAFALHPQPSHPAPAATRVSERPESAPEEEHGSSALSRTFAFAPSDRSPMLPEQMPSPEAVRERLLKWVDLEKAGRYRNDPLALIDAVLRHRARLDDRAIDTDGADGTVASDEAMIEAAVLFHELNGRTIVSVSDALKAFRAALGTAREQADATNLLFAPAEHTRSTRPTFDGFGLRHAAGKSFDDLLADADTFGAPALANSAPQARRAWLAAKFEEMGESTAYRFGTVEHSMASAVIRLQQYRGEPVTAALDRPDTLIATFRALEAAWEKDRRYPMHPRLLFALHLAHASGAEFGSANEIARRYDEAAFLAVQAGLDHKDRAHLDWMTKYSAQLKVPRGSWKTDAEEIRRDAVQWMTSALYELQLTEAQRTRIAAELARVGTSSDALVAGEWQSTANTVVQYASARASAVFDPPPYFDARAMARDALLSHGMTPEQISERRTFRIDAPINVDGVENIAATATGGTPYTGDYVDEFLRRASAKNPRAWALHVGASEIDTRKAYESAEVAFNGRLPSDPWVRRRAEENLRQRGEARTDETVARECATVAAGLTVETESERERGELDDTLIGMVPIVGSLYNIEEGIRHRDALRAALGVLFLGIDAFTVMGGSVIARATGSTVAEVVAEEVTEAAVEREGGASRPHRAVLELQARVGEPGLDARRLATDPRIAEITIDPIDIEPRDANVPDAYKVLAREVRDGRTDASVGGCPVVHLANEDRVVPVREHGGSYEEVDWYTGHRVAGARVIMRDTQTGVYRTGGGLAGGGPRMSRQTVTAGAVEIRGTAVSERFTARDIPAQMARAQDATVRDFDRLFREHFAFSEGLPDPSISSFDGQAFYKTVYERSATFRRLFNYHAEHTEVSLPQERWKIHMGDPGPKNQPAYVLWDSKEIFLPDDKTLTGIDYVTGAGRAPVPHERVFLHEMIHAVTGLEDPTRTTSLLNRGPVVYLTDKILTEAGYSFPERVMYWVKNDDATTLRAETVAYNRPNALEAAHAENAYLDAIVDKGAPRMTAQTPMGGVPVAQRTTVEGATWFAQARGAQPSQVSFEKTFNARFSFDPSMSDVSSDHIIDTLADFHKHSATFRDLFDRVSGGAGGGAVPERERFMYVTQEHGTAPPSGTARPIREVDFDRRRIYLNEDGTQYLSADGLVDMEFKRKLVQRTVRALLKAARAEPAFDRSLNRGLDVYLTDRILQEAKVRYPSQIAAQLVRRGDTQAAEALLGHKTLALRTALAEDRYLASPGTPRVPAFV